MVIGEPIAKQMLGFAGGDQALANRMVDAYRAHNGEILPTMPLYAGVRETLIAIKARGQTVGLVTSKGRGAANISLDGHAIAPHFDLVMASDDTKKHKPDPEPLLEAARRLGIPPESIAYVGDSVHDIRCALGAGCLAVAALWGPFEVETLLALKPHHAVKSLADLVELTALHPPTQRGTK
jgi:pyrophosphatase PpaX